MKKIISLFIVLCMTIGSMPILAEDYIYPSSEAFKNQEDISQLTVDALSMYEVDSLTYDFTTNDKEVINAVLEVLNGCRLKAIGGVFASEAPTFLVKVKYADNTEAYETFGMSTVRIDDKRYLLLHEDYQKIEECIKTVKKEIFTKKKFSDVPQESQLYDAVRLLSPLGIMSGYEDNTFKSSNALTRAEAAAIIVRLLKLHEDLENAETMFSDVPESHWASGYVNQAVANCIIEGQGDGTFAPEEKVTYHQFVKMLVCALCYEEMAIYNGGWNNGGYLYVAEKIGLTENETQNPDEHITRGEAALLCYKALDIDMMDLSCDGGKQHGEFYSEIGRTILNMYWGMEYEPVKAFYFEKTFGFKLPEGSECVEGEYFVENNLDETCYIGKISFDKKDFEYIKENLEKQDFEKGAAVEDSDVVHDGRHLRDTHTTWWSKGRYNTEKAHYHWIKEDRTYRYTHSVEFEAFIAEDRMGAYWLYVYKYDKENVNI